jgi:GNAT superfamily N-acetyltransferase
LSSSTRTPANLTVRRARPEDLGAAGLLFDSAPLEYTRLAGSERRAREVFERVWAQPGHSASFEFCWIAEVGLDLAGMLLGFAARDRVRLHAALVRRSLPCLPMVRWVVLFAALAQLAWRTPRPPADSVYVAAVAVAPAYRRRRVGSVLGDAAQAYARDGGFAQVAAHTGGRHPVARAGLEHYGLRAAAERRGGYVLYVKALGG